MIDLPQCIRNEAKRAEFFAELVKRIDTVASLENAQAESQAAIERNRKEADEILTKVKADAQAVERTARATLEDALKALQKSKADGDKIVSEAKAKSETILAEAGNRLNKVLAEVEKESKRLDELADQIEITEKTRILTAERADAEAARLESIKAAIAKFTA